MRRTVLVTGASSGIGLATALHLAALGFHTVGSARSEAKARAIEQAAEHAGVPVEPVVFDVADVDACERTLAGRELYGLVNNAGYYNVGAIADVPPDDARRQLEVMTLAPMRLAQLALPAMRDRGQGRIVNVVSTLGHATGPLTGWYQASKHALSAVSDALRIEEAPHGVEVVRIEPGGTNTRIWDNAEDDLRRRRPASRTPQAYDRALGVLRALKGRMHAPQVVAETIGTALTAGRPKARYRVGIDAAALEWANRIAPVAVKDRLARTTLGL